LRRNFKYAAYAARREAAYTCCIRHIHAKRDSGLCPLWFKTDTVLNPYDYTNGLAAACFAVAAEIAIWAIIGAIR
jgi:hypothetical protein